MPRKRKPIEMPKINPPDPLYDGNLIYRAEGSLESDIYFYDRQEDTVIECTDYVRELIRERLLIKTDKKAEKEFKNENDERIADIINNGKLRLHILLKAARGNEYDYKKLMDLVDFVRSQRGRIDAYGKEIVQGYPALAFLQADTRFALARSDFKFYLDWYENGLNPADFRTTKAFKTAQTQREKKANDQIDKTRSLLVQKSEKSKRKDMREHLYRSEGAMKYPPEFNFKGLELLEFGVVDKLFSDLAALKRKFSQNLME